MSTRGAAAPDARAMVDDVTYLRVQRFLYREALLLDRREYGAWLSLLAADIQYCVTAAVDRDAQATPKRYAIIDESLAGLKARIAQISDPRLTRAENPPSLLRRFVSNIEVYHTSSPDELSVVSYLLAHRVRHNSPQGHFYVAERADVLRAQGAELFLARRSVALDLTILFGGALSAVL